MPAKNPRINVVLEKPPYRRVQHLAKSEGATLSLKVRDLIKEALEAHEDIILAKFAEDRERTFDRERALPQKKE